VKLRRRDALKAAAAVVVDATATLAGCAAAPILAPPQKEETAMNARPLLTLRLATAPVQNVGAVPHGTRTIFPVIGGDFEGPRLRGKVLPGGGDWAVLRADGVLELDLRITLETDDGALIHMTFQGLRDDAAHEAAAPGGAEASDPPRPYFRTLPRFETAAPRYAFLNRILAVGSGEIRASGDVGEPGPDAGEHGRRWSATRVRLSRRSSHHPAGSRQGAAMVVETGSAGAREGADEPAAHVMVLGEDGHPDGPEAGGRGVLDNLLAELVRVADQEPALRSHGLRQRFVPVLPAQILGGQRRIAGNAVQPGQIDRPPCPGDVVRGQVAVNANRAALIIGEHAERVVRVGPEAIREHDGGVPLGGVAIGAREQQVGPGTLELGLTRQATLRLDVLHCGEVQDRHLTIRTVEPQPIRELPLRVLVFGEHDGLPRPGVDGPLAAIHGPHGAPFPRPAASRSILRKAA
jgi:Protein of unknown function (DUF3237)